jgi:hypothetical protein
MSKRYLSIACSNGGTGVYGHSSGTPQLRFDIANQGLLQTQELRLQGTLKIIATALTGGIAVGNQNTSLANDVNINPFVGAQSFIDNIELSTRVNATRSIEKINNYPMLVSSLLSALHSKTGYDANLYHEQGSKGIGMTTSEHNARTSGTNPFTIANQTQAQKKPFLQLDGFDFDLRLICGMFMGQEQIDLEALGGLSIVINCNSDDNVLFGAVAGNFRYEIHNPRIIVPVMDKTPQQQLATRNQGISNFNFLTFVSLYNTLSSTDQQVVHRVNLQSVVSNLQHYIPVNHINNTARDSIAQYNPAIERLTYLQNGKRTPLEFVLEPEKEPNINAHSQLTTTPQLLLNYLDAYRNFRDVKKSCVNPVVSGFASQTARVGVWGTGCSYDSVGQNGINANGSTLGFEIKSSLDDPLNRNNQTPYAVYTFYLCKNQVQVDTSGKVNVGM